MNFIQNFIALTVTQTFLFIKSYERIKNIYIAYLGKTLHCKYQH